MCQPLASHWGNHVVTMLEWTVACSMYLAMPVTNAFLSSKLVLKFGWKEKENHHMEVGITGLVSCSVQHPPGRAVRTVGAQCRAAGQAEGALPRGPRWTVHPPASPGLPSWPRTKHKAPALWGRARQSLQGGVLRVLLPCAFSLGSWGWQRHLRQSLGPGISLGPHQQGSHNTAAACRGIGHKGQHTCQGFLPPSHLRAIILEGSLRGSDNPFTELGAGRSSSRTTSVLRRQAQPRWATVLPTDDAFQEGPPSGVHTLRMKMHKVSALTPRIQDSLQGPIRWGPMAMERKEGEGYWQRTESLNSVTATQKHRKADGLNLIHLC